MLTVKRFVQNVTSLVRVEVELTAKEEFAILEEVIGVKVSTNGANAATVGMYCRVKSDDWLED